MEFQLVLLNRISYSSTIICPITTNVKKDSEILRVHLNKGTANIHQTCDIMIDQVRAIDNKRLIKKVGNLPNVMTEIIKENLQIIMDLEYSTIA